MSIQTPTFIDDKIFLLMTEILFQCFFTYLSFKCSLSQEEEFYVCIYASREGSQVLFHHEGGVDVGDVDTRAQKLSVRIDDKLTEEIVIQQLLKHVTDEKKE